MITQPYAPELAKRLKLAARAANDALGAELVRQFGLRAAQCRYLVTKHDAATRAACERAYAADAAYTALLLAGELRYFGPALDSTRDVDLGRAA
jgi:hypothetical protein